MPLYAPNFRAMAPYKTEQEIHDAWRAALLATPDVSAIPAGWTTRGVTYNLSRATANVLSNFYDWATETAPGASGLLKNCFLATAEGAGLDMIGEGVGLKRIQPVEAELQFLLERLDGFVGDIPLPVEVHLSAASEADPDRSVYFTIEFATGAKLNSGDPSLLANGIARVTGSASNLADGTSMTLMTAVPGISAVYVEQTVQHGTNIETDENYRVRILATADTGSLTLVEKYEAWALSVPGIDSARVVAPSSRGPCAVDITVSTSDGAATLTEMDAVLAYITERAPATDDVEVYTALITRVSATVALYTPKGSNLSGQFADIKASVEDALAACFDATNDLGVTAFGIAQDVTLDGLREAIFKVVPATQRQRIQFSSVSVTVGSYNSATGVISVGSNYVAKPGTFTVTVAEASDY